MTDPDYFLFLSLFWAPTLLAAGIGIFVSPAHYARMYRDLEKQPLAVLTLGILALSFGLAQSLTFQNWTTIPTAIVSALGVGLLLKGLVMIIAPGITSRLADWWLDRGLIPFSGGALIVLGSYLGYLVIAS